MYAGLSNLEHMSFSSQALQFFVIEVIRMVQVHGYILECFRNFVLATLNLKLISLLSHLMLLIWLWFRVFCIAKSFDDIYCRSSGRLGVGHAIYISGLTCSITKKKLWAITVPYWHFNKFKFQLFSSKISSYAQSWRLN